MAAEFVERLGARMRERREELGISMAEVARRMPGKVNENQVYRWEQGKHQPKPDTLEALAKVLETTVATLMAPAPEKTETPDPFGVADADRLERIETSVTQMDARLATIESQLTHLLGATANGTVAPMKAKTAEELIDGLRSLAREAQELVNQQGRRIGKRELQRRDDQGPRRPPRRRDAA